MKDLREMTDYERNRYFEPGFCGMVLRGVAYIGAGAIVYALVYGIIALGLAFIAARFVIGA